MSIDVVNRISVCGAEQEKINEVFDFFRGVNGDMDFNKIIPMPKELIHTRKGSCEDESWAYYQAKELEDYKELDELLTCAWVKEEGIKTREELLKHLEESYKEAERICPEELKTGFATISEYGKYQHELYQKYGYRNHVDWALNNWNCSWNAFDSEREENMLKFMTLNSCVIPLIWTTSEKFPEVDFVYEVCDQCLEKVARLIIRAGEIICEYIPDEGTEEQLRLATQILGYRPEFF